MNIIMMTTGKSALGNVLTGGAAPVISTFDIGSSYNFILDPDANTVLPDPPVFSGTYQNIYKTVVTNDEIILSVIMLHTYTFPVGNIMLRLSNGQPFMWMDLGQAYYKVSTNEVEHYAGDLYIAPFVIKYPGISLLLNISNLPDFYAQGPAIQDITYLIDPYEVLPDQQLINNSTYTFNMGRPVYTTSTADGLWWGCPFAMALDDVRCWRIDGGHTGDKYVYSPQLTGPS